MGKRILLLIFILWCSGYHLNAQNKLGSLAGYIKIKPENYNLSPDGAVIKLTTERDTLFAVVVGGEFLFNKVSAGKATISVSHLNFEHLVREVMIKKDSVTIVSLDLKEKTRTIEEVTVTGKAPLITVIGDTIKFNAAAVKLLEGDEVLEILKNIPGVEISATGISILGQNIARTYVDKRMVFGTGTMSALTNMPASDVISINTYEEPENLNKKTKRSGDNKVRVLDIKTKSKLISATNAHFLTSYGHDFEKIGRIRYGVGATANFFSEKLLLSTNAFTNNINRNSNRVSDVISVGPQPVGYNKKSYLNMNVVKNWGTDLFKNNVCIESGYEYTQDNSLTNDIRQKIFFHSSDQAQRIYYDSVINNSVSNIHNAMLNLYIVKPSLGNICLLQSLQFEDNYLESNHASTGYSDRNRAYSFVGKNFNNNSRMIQESLSMSNTFNKIGYRGEISYHYNNLTGLGYREDSLSSTIFNKILRSNLAGAGNYLKIGGELTFYLTKEDSKTTISLSTKYDYSYENTKSKCISINITNPSFNFTDSVNTYDYTRNYNTQTANLKLNLKNGHERLSVSATYQSVSVNRDDFFPESEHFGKRQNAILPEILYERNFGSNKLSINYNTLTILPSIEEWRPRLDNSNPLQLTAGNTTLKQSYVHSLQSSFIGMNMKGQSLIFIIRADIINNKIGNKTQFFMQPTTLHEWNYEAPSQSILTTYENIGRMITGSVGAAYEQSLQKIKSKLSIRPMFKYEDLPSYMNEKYNRTKSYEPSISISLQSNFSRVFRISIETKNRYVYSNNSFGVNTEFLNLTGGFNAEWQQIFKKFYLKTSYNISFYKSFTGQFANTTNHILNTIVGIKSFKNKLDISFAAYDILNRNNSFQTNVFADYVQNKWAQQFGRYFTFNLAFKFYKSKSGLNHPEGIILPDGGVRDIYKSK